jgi:hypothetical protein
MTLNGLKGPSIINPHRTNLALALHTFVTVPNGKLLESILIHVTQTRYEDAVLGRVVYHSQQQRSAVARIQIGSSGVRGRRCPDEKITVTIPVDVGIPTYALAKPVARGFPSESPEHLLAQCGRLGNAEHKSGASHKRHPCTHIREPGV